MCWGGRAGEVGDTDGDSKLYWRRSGCCIPAETLQGLREGDSLTDGQRRMESTRNRAVGKPVFVRLPALLLSSPELALVN